MARANKRNSKRLFVFKTEEDPQKGKLFSFTKKKEKPEPEIEEKSLFEVGPKEEKKEEKGLMESVIKTKETGKKRAILGPAPEAPKRVIIDRSAYLKKRVGLLRNLLTLLIIAFLGLAAYFYIELTPTFDLLNSVLGPSSSQQVEIVNDQVKNLQTNINEYGYFAVKNHLDHASYLGDEFLQALSEFEKASEGSAEAVARQQQLNDLKSRLQIHFDSAREIVRLPDWDIVAYHEEPLPQEEIKFEFDTLLRESLAAQKEDILHAAPTETGEARIEDIEELMPLIGNRALINTLKRTTDFNALSNENIAQILEEVNNLTRNEIAIIQTIKENRIKWSEVITNIENVTRTVDLYYDQGFFEEIGGISYSSYDFDTVNNRVVITGQTKKYDATNFSQIAELIEALEQSKYFKDVSMRSFTKSGDEEAGYLGTLKLELALQKEEFHEGDELTSVELGGTAEEPGVSRVSRIPRNNKTPREKISEQRIRRLVSQNN